MISPCDIAGLISNVSEEVATQIAKNCRRRQTHCHVTVTPPPRGTPAVIIRIHPRLIGWKLRIFPTPLLFGISIPYVPFGIWRWI